MRSPRAGRNWETFGGLFILARETQRILTDVYYFTADPYLSGEAGYQTITGIQSSGVQAW